MTHDTRVELRLLPAAVLALTVGLAGCAKKTEKTDSRPDNPPGQGEPEARQKKKPAPKVVVAAADDNGSKKTTGETSPAKKDVEKKVAEKTDPKAKTPIAKAKTGKKPDDGLVPISKVTTRAQAKAHLEALKPEFKYNSLDELQKINFEATDVTDEHLALLKYFPYVSSINLTGTKITDAGVAHLKEMERLTELYLYSTPISDAGVKHLAGLTRLEQLCLDKTLVTDKGVAHLKRLVELWRLHLQSRNKTTDAVFTSLADMKRLTELHIHGTGFTEERVKLFRQRNPRCRVVWDKADPKKDEPDPPRKKGQVP